MRIDTSFLVNTSTKRKAFWKSMIMNGPMAIQNCSLLRRLRSNNKRMKLMEQTRTRQKSKVIVRQNENKVIPLIITVQNLPVAMMTLVNIGKKFFEIFIFVSTDEVLIQKLVWKCAFPD